jgi:3-methyladenine DNA glycosylase/8-oxoguanine DNA glycosylase
VAAGTRRPAPGGFLEVEVRPPWPYRLPAGGGGDAVMQVRRGVATRLLHVDGVPVVVRAAQRRDGSVLFRADGGSARCRKVAIERMRFALGVDDDYRAFYDRFRSDRLVGAAVRRRRWHRPRRRPWPWEALAWAITKQLIESSRAAAIQRRMVYRWGAEGRGPDGTTLREVPTPELLADRAPAELAATDLAPARALALIRAAREVVTGRIDPGDSGDDRRLLAIREIGPWTVQCLGLHGRGEPDSLPAGDLAFVKLVGRLVGHRRYATVAEVEEFFAPYAPYRGLAGSFVLAAHHGLVAQGPTLGLAA